MDIEYCKELLKKKEESDWIDFKGKLKLYDSARNLNTPDRDELIKDILGLANGNSLIIKKTKYLIIGADDKKFTDDGIRVLHNVDYQVPTMSQLSKWLNSASSPAIVGLQSCFFEIDNNVIFVIEIPPTFELHETIRELNAKGKFSKFTVFMRQDEHTLPASVRDGITIRELKLLHRQEVSNPSSIIVGVITGAFIALLFWISGYNAEKIPNQYIEFIAKLLPVIFGAFLGYEIGYVFKEANAVRYDWKFIPRKKQLRIVFGTIMAIIFIIGMYFLPKLFI